MGGFDIFKSTWDGNKWSKPENLGYPLNTPDDDVYYYVSEKTNRGYLSTYREGGLGEKDIYEVIPIAKVKLIVTIKDSISQKNILDPDIKLSFSVENDSLKKYYNEIRLDSSENSLYLQSFKKYTVKIEKNGNLFYYNPIEIPLYEAEGNSIEKEFVIRYYTDSLSAGLKNLLITKTEVKPKIDSTIISKNYIFGNIFFEKNISKINPSYIPTLKKLITILKENKELKIEIQGFADEDGDDNFNKKLSELRALNVYDYLLSRGVSPKQIVFKGYGKTSKFGSGDSEEEKKLNRRVQFLKIN
jgi:outer membrane protein OmpA-like peptidoglycan-associated protein